MALRVRAGRRSFPSVFGGVTRRLTSDEACPERNVLTEERILGDYTLSRFA
jgi:hypothetical protein